MGRKVIYDLVTEQQQSKCITENSPQKQNRNGWGGGDYMCVGGRGRLIYFKELASTMVEIQLQKLQRKQARWGQRNS